jgi:hypothetical protein
MNRLEKMKAIRRSEIYTVNNNKRSHRRWFLVLIQKVQSFIFCTVLFPFLTIVDEKIFLSIASSIVKSGKFLVWLY